jgi:hypothetical protein
MCFECVDEENAGTYLNVFSMDNTHLKPFLYQLESIQMMFKMILAHTCEQLCKWVHHVF